MRNPTGRERASITTARYSDLLPVLKIPKVDGGFLRVALLSRWSRDRNRTLSRVSAWQSVFVDFLVTFIDLGYQTPWG